MTTGTTGRTGCRAGTAQADSSGIKPSKAIWIPGFQFLIGSAFFRVESFRLLISLATYIIEKPCGQTQQNKEKRYIHREYYEQSSSRGLIMYLPTLSASLFVVVLTLVCTLKPVWHHRRIFCTSSRLMSPWCSNMEKSSREKNFAISLSSKKDNLYELI
jgi:hypothetical protein